MIGTRRLVYDVDRVSGGPMLKQNECAVYYVE